MKTITEYLINKTTKETPTIYDLYDIMVKLDNKGMNPFNFSKDSNFRIKDNKYNKDYRLLYVFYDKTIEHLEKDNNRKVFFGVTNESENIEKAFRITDDVTLYNSSDKNADAVAELVNILKIRNIAKG